MIVALGTFQQMKGDEARHAVEMAVALEPDLLEVVLGAFAHFEAIHGNEHGCVPSLRARRIAEKARISRAFCNSRLPMPASDN